MDRKELDSIVDALKRRAGEFSASSISPSVFENLKFNIDSAVYTIKSVAKIYNKDQQSIAIEPWDKSMLTHIMPAIERFDSDLSLSVSSESIIVRMPLFSEERRVSLSKKVTALGEDYKNSVRNARRNNIALIKKEEKDGSISEDDMHKRIKDTDSIANEYIDKISKIINDKVASIKQM